MGRQNRATNHACVLYTTGCAQLKEFIRQQPKKSERDRKMAARHAASAALSGAATVFALAGFGATDVSIGWATAEFDGITECALKFDLGLLRWTETACNGTRIDALYAQGCNLDFCSDCASAGRGAVALLMLTVLTGLGGVAAIAFRRAALLDAKAAEARGTMVLAPGELTREASIGCTALLCVWTLCSAIIWPAQCFLSLRRTNGHQRSKLGPGFALALTSLSLSASALASEILVRHSHEGGRARYRTSGTDVKSEVRISEPGSDFKDQYMASEIDDENIEGHVTSL